MKQPCPNTICKHSNFFLSKTHNKQLEFKTSFSICSQLDTDNVVVFLFSKNKNINPFRAGPTWTDGCGCSLADSVRPWLTVIKSAPLAALTQTWSRVYLWNNSSTSTLLAN